MGRGIAPSQTIVSDGRFSVNIYSADSIVRGTTSQEIVQMAKDVGAKSVVFASCAPPIRHCNVYGIDMPSRHELVAHDRDEDEIARVIGADLVIYQTLDDLVESCRQFNPKIPQFDCSVFTGEYVTGGINDAYLDNVEKLRNDKAKAKKGSTWQAEAEQENFGCSGPMSEQRSSVQSRDWE
jgi:amidophosphoribosyltransferase